MILLPRDNDALEHNPPVATNNITEDGSSLGWAIMALHAVIFLGLLGWSFTFHARRRAFHYIAVFISLITTIYYFVMASDLGSVPVRQYMRVGNIPDRTRQVFYARWIGYFVNFSVIFFSLAILSGVDWPSVIFTTALTMLWAVLYLAGALAESSYKWGFLVFAILTHFVIAWQLLGVHRGLAGRHDVVIRNAFTNLAAYELFLTMLYAIAWGVSEGGNVISNDSEMAFYVVLDVLSQGVFAVLLVLQTRRLDLEYLGLGFGDHGRLHGTSTARHPVANNGHAKTEAA